MKNKERQVQSVSRFLNYENYRFYKSPFFYEVYKAMLAFLLVGLFVVLFMSLILSTHFSPTASEIHLATFSAFSIQLFFTATGLLLTLIFGVFIIIVWLRNRKITTDKARHRFLAYMLIYLIIIFACVGPFFATISVDGSNALPFTFWPLCISYWVIGLLGLVIQFVVNMREIKYGTESRLFNSIFKTSAKTTKTSRYVIVPGILFIIIELFLGASVVMLVGFLATQSILQYCEHRFVRQIICWYYMKKLGIDNHSV